MAHVLRRIGGRGTASVCVWYVCRATTGMETARVLDAGCLHKCVPRTVVDLPYIIRVVAQLCICSRIDRLVYVVRSTRRKSGITNCKYNVTNLSTGSLGGLPSATNEGLGNSALHGSGSCHKCQ